VSDDQILVVSGRLGQFPQEPPASSYFTAITVKCAAARE